MNHKELAYLSLRLGFGLNLLLQGVMRFVDWREFEGWLEVISKETIFPEQLVTFGLSFVPSVYFILGFFLLIGFRTKWVLTACSLFFIILMVGTGVLEQWDKTALETTYLFISALLLFFSEYDRGPIRLKAGQKVLR